MSDEPDTHERGGTPVAPAAARPSFAPPAKPAAPRLPPPPAFAPPPKLASASPVSAPKPAASASASPASVLAPKLASVPSTKPAAAPAAKPAASTAKPAASTAKPAASAAAAAKPDAPSLEALRRSAGASPRPGAAPPGGAVGLPPPPEFLPRASSAELPLERWTGGDLSEELSTVTLPGIPPERASVLRGKAVASEPPAGVDDEDDDAPLDLEGLEGDAPAQARAPAEADDGVEVDIDVSEDTVPRLALREPYPVLPVVPSQVPTAPVPVVGGAPPTSDAAVAKAARAARIAPAGPRARTTRALEAPLPEPTPLRLWIGVGAALGAVISIAALWWMSSSSAPDKDASPTPPSSEATPTAEAKAVAPEPTSPVPEAKAVAPEPTPPVPEAKAEVVPEPTPAEPPTDVAPEPAEPPTEAEPPSEASVITVKRDPSDYRRAAAEYRATGSHEALMAMTTAACALGDGPRARAAFRKLVGRAARTKAIVACREWRVDVTSTVDGYTGPELLAQARAALEDGDVKTAYDKAHQSNKVERSSDAVLVKALAACKLGDGEQAQRLLPHVSIKARPRLVEGCKDAGIELRD